MSESPIYRQYDELLSEVNRLRAENERLRDNLSNALCGNEISKNMQRASAKELRECKARFHAVMSVTDEMVEAGAIGLYLCGTLSKHEAWRDMCGRYKDSYRADAKRIIGRALRAAYAQYRNLRAAEGVRDA